jgi:LPXTG-motif cell wall-anchored protein
MFGDAKNRNAHLLFGIPFALAVIVAATASPAMAHHKSGHTNGKPKSAVVTEDNDGDGQPNTPDRRGDSDNRHPSGRDKHAESGNSGNQGKSSSDPDDDGRGPDRSDGGADKPGGRGGLDVEDQDGNNGCGNDDDFEDDNEGRCGRKPHPEKPDEDDPEHPGEGDVTHRGRLKAHPIEVLSDVERAMVPAKINAAVALLPVTGATVIPFAIIGLACISLGGALVVVRRRG